jgi:perosamine synthetase
MIPIYKPYIPKNSLRYAHDALDSTWISSQGKYISLATEKIKEILRVKNILLLNNGTSATHLVAKALNKKYPNIKNIIAPNNVYVAAWNSFLFDKNYKISTIDADLDTWNIDQNQIKNKKNHALLVVHNIGNIINVPLLQEKFPNLIYVEDNCEGLFGKYNDKFSGTHSFASSISFFGNKNVTSGEGGAVIINDDETFEYIKCVHGQGQSSTRFIHSELGYNYRITNVQAAILLGQLEILDEILDKKKSIFEEYKENFKNIENIFLQKEDQSTSHSNWMFGIRIIGNKSYNAAESYFKTKGIEIRPMFYSASAHQHLLNNKNFNINLEKNSKILNQECIILPSFPELTSKEVKHIVSCVKDYVSLL